MKHLTESWSVKSRGFQDFAFNVAKQDSTEFAALRAERDELRNALTRLLYFAQPFTHPPLCDDAELSRLCRDAVAAMARGDGK